MTCSCKEDSSGRHDGGHFIYAGAGRVNEGGLPGRAQCSELTRMSKRNAHGGSIRSSKPKVFVVADRKRENQSVFYRQQKKGLNALNHRYLMPFLNLT